MELWPESDRLSSSWLIPRTEERAYTVTITWLFITVMLIGQQCLILANCNQITKCACKKTTAVYFGQLSNKVKTSTVNKQTQS